MALPPLIERVEIRNRLFEEETSLIPEVVALVVVEEMERHLKTALPRSYVADLADKARTCYAHNDRVRRRLRAPGDHGREWLYVFMRHWLAARLQADRPHLYARLPLV